MFSRKQKCQKECVFNLCLFNLYPEYIIEIYAKVKTDGRNVSNFKVYIYSDLKQLLQYISSESVEVIPTGQ